MAGQKPLSPKQLKFVELYLGGMTAKAAYIAAEYKARGHSAETNAERLLRNAEVKRLVEAARKQGEGKAGITAEWWYGRMRLEAEREGIGASHAARVAALKVIGQAAGYVSDNVKLSGDRENPLQLEGANEHHAELPAAGVVAGVLRALGLPAGGAG